MVKAAKSRVKTKKQTEKQLVKAPVEFVFWCHDGRIFSDLAELAEGLAAMSDETFAYHSNAEKQDFSNWVRNIIGDELLANYLYNLTDRLRAADYVSARITLLSGK
jgi:protoporphyrinogen oxidase